MGQQVAGVREGVEKTRRAVTRNLQAIREDLPKDEARDSEQIGQRILSADFKSVQEQAASDETDFASAMEAIHEVTEAMDVEFKSLVTPNASEIAIVDGAKARVRRLEQDLAQASLPSFWKSLLKARNQQKVAKLTSDLEAARQAITDAESDVQMKVRRRLQEASMEDSVSTYVALSRKTEEIMKKRILELDEQIGVMKDRQVFVLGEKEMTTKKIESLTKELEGRQSELETQQGVLTTLQNGTTEYSTQEQVVSNLNVAVERIRSDREASLSYYQAKEDMLKKIEIAVIATTKLRGRHQARVLRLHSDTEERSRMYPNHLLNMKTMSDQSFDKLIREIGIKTDQNVTEANAQAIVAADNDFLTCIEEHPALLRRTEAVNKALRQHLTTTRQRIDNALRELAEGYDGVSKGNSLFVPTSDGQGDAPSGDDPAAPAPTTTTTS